jgi:hypothetical protein
MVTIARVNGFITILSGSISSFYAYIGIYYRILRKTTANLSEYAIT